MVYQMPCPGKDGVSKEVFVASSYECREQAERELQRWAEGNGYRFAEAERTFTIYGREQQPRKWVLMRRSEELSF